MVNGVKMEKQEKKEIAKLQQKERTKGWLIVFSILFTSITVGSFLFAIGNGFNLAYAAGISLIVGGALFSFIALDYFLTLWTGFD